MKAFSKTEDKFEDKPANFETAITATEWGWFNLLLILLIFPAGWANSIESTTMSYVFPVAQCDLSLSLEDKGLLNAITYSGMISSAIVWGFLFDTLGRRKLLMIGYVLGFVCAFISGLAQNKEMLIASKFFGGFIINGPYAAFATYISEFHSCTNRARMQLLIGIIFCLGGIVLPWLAWGTMSYNIHFFLFNNALEFHSWNIFLVLCSVPALISAIAFIFTSESPKFLMTTGDNERAMMLFQRIYSINTRRPRDTFPIKNLIDEIGLNKPTKQITAKRSQTQALKEGWQQMKPLFFKPYLPNLILVCIIQALFTMSVNTIRLWLPQIFQALNDYQYYTNETNVDLCEALDTIRPSNDSDTCSFNSDNTSVYLNSTILGVIVIICQTATLCFANKIMKKKLLVILGLSAAGCCFALYFSMNVAYAVAFSSIYTGLAAAGANVVQVINIELFPTTLRTMTLSIALMCGRIGSMIGNLLFPLLILAGCAPPFFVVGSLAIVGALLSLLLPTTDRKELE